jgi:FkbM family methyltransferase
MSVTEIIKRAAKILSLDIRRYSDRNIFPKRIVRFLSERHLNLVIDVGANRGQFGNTLYEHGFSGTLVSFEPIPLAYDKLKIAAKNSGRDWRIARRMALSSEKSTAKLTIAQNSASSSLLEFSDRLEACIPIAKAVDEITVDTERLDVAIRDFDLNGRKMAIKIDTQGSEMSVLKGCANIEKDIEMIILETSIGQLYIGQPSYHEIDDFLRKKGWKLGDIEPGYRDPETLQLLEFDGVYIR